MVVFNALPSAITKKKVIEETLADKTLRNMAEWIKNGFKRDDEMNKIF